MAVLEDFDKIGFGLALRRRVPYGPWFVWAGGQLRMWYFTGSGFLTAVEERPDGFSKARLRAKLSLTLDGEHYLRDDPKVEEEMRRYL